MRSLAKKLGMILLSCLFVTQAFAAATCSPPPVCGEHQATRWNGSNFECVDLVASYSSCAIIHATPGQDYISCPNRGVALALYFESYTWSETPDTHAGPEINAIHCCTLALSAAE
jgi:hypothetical protein